MEDRINKQRYNSKGGREVIIDVINDKLARLLWINDAHNSIWLLSNIGLFKDKDTVMKGLIDIIDECKQEDTKHKKEWQSANRDSQWKNIQSLAERIMNICINERSLHHLQIERGDIIQECITSIYTDNPRPEYDEILCWHIVSRIITYVLHYNNILPIKLDKKTLDIWDEATEKVESGRSFNDILREEWAKKWSFPLLKAWINIDNISAEWDRWDEIIIALRKVFNDEYDNYEINKTKSIIKAIIKEIVYQKVSSENVQRNCLIIRQYYFWRNEKDKKPWTFDTLSEYITDMNQGNKISWSRIQQIIQKVERSLIQKIRALYSK